MDTLGKSNEAHLLKMMIERKGLMYPARFHDHVGNTICE